MPKKDVKRLKIAREKLAKQLNGLIKASEKLLEPLKDLDEEQTAALVALVYSTRLIMFAGRPAAKLDKRILARFKRAVDEICPPLGTISVSRDPCFEASVQYVQALKKCEDEGRSEEECFEAGRYGAQAVGCTMEELEEMRGKLRDMFGRIKPPRPLPWPK